MLKLKCKNCGAVLLEAEARWEAVSRTGMCPNCSWFYDDAKEIEVQRITRDPKIVADTRSLKIREIAIGSAATIGSAVGIIFFLAAGLATGTFIFVFCLGFLLLFGLKNLIHGILYGPAREARSRIARRTDLRALARQQEASGVFSEGLRRMEQR